MVVNVVVNQGASKAYYPNAVQIGGSAQTIKWLGGAAPTATVSKIELYTFVLIRANTTSWIVTGQQAKYG